MATVLRFRNHAHAPSDKDSLSLRAAKSAAARSAKTSKVISIFPTSAAKATTAAQWGAGMPRVCQPLTVESDCPSAPATAPVLPRSTMIDFQDAMSGTLVRTMRTCQGFATCETTNAKNYVAIGSMTDPDRIIAARLKALRLELGYKHQNAFAEELGIEKNTYNPFETGKRPLTFEVACKIRNRFGISVDWLFFGDMGHASNDILLRIGREPGQPVRATGGRK